MVLVLAVLIGCDSGRFQARPAPQAAPQPPPPEDVPLDDLAVKPPFAGLDSMVAGEGRIVLLWQPALTADGTPDPRYAYQVFVGSEIDTVDFTAPALETAAGASSAEIVALPDGVPVFATVRADLLSGATPDELEDRNQMVLGAVPRPVLYVDPEAPPGGDGKTPATALNTLTEALIAALRQGGANIWAVAADFEESLFLPDDVSIYGGFAPGFDPLERGGDPIPSRLVASGSGGTLLSVTPGKSWRVADGFALDGGGKASVGALVDKAKACLVGLHVTDTRSDGIDTRGGLSKLVHAVLHRCTVERAGAEGLDHAGPARLVIQRCRVNASRNEGLQANDLAVLPDGLSEIVIRASSFTSNGDEGVDIDLDEIDPTVGGTSIGGFERILVEDCFVAGNGLAGLLMDVDFDATDQIGAVVRLRTSRIRDNGITGIRIDADQPLTALVDGCLVTANDGPGVILDGDSDVPLLSLANCFLMANAGRGIELLAPSVVACLFSAVTWNDGEGIAAPKGAILVESSVLTHNAGGDLARGQARYSLVGEGEPGTGNVSGKPRFARVPDRVVFLGSAGHVDRFTSPVASLFRVDDLIETVDDGVERTVVGVKGQEVTFAPVRERALEVADPISRFSAVSVLEDLRLQSGSPLIDAAWPPVQDRDGSPADIGVLGGPLGDVPGFTRLPAASAGPPFVVNRLDVRPGGGAPPATIRLGLSLEADPASLSPDTLIVRRDGVDVAGKRRTAGLDLVFTPDKPLTTGLYTVGVGPGLRALAGTPILVVFDFEVRFK